MENPQVQPTTVDTRVKGVSKKQKKREFKNRKTFSLKAMEALVDRVGFLKNKYEALSINAQEKLGYHYNEILNILLFHKYVKGNKKLFDNYKKIKDAINKGYEFDKKKKLEENKMKNMLKESSATHFAINKKTNKILESWNYNGYEQDELKTHKNEYFIKDLNRNYPFLNENDIVVVTPTNLKKRQLNESNKKDWQKFNYSHFALLKETNHILYGFDYSDVDKNELTKNKNEYFLNVISEVYGSDISPKDVVVVKSNKLKKLGIKDYLNESNWVGLINEAYCGSNTDEMIDEDIEEEFDEEGLEESSTMAGAFPSGPEPTGGYPVANPNKKVYGDGKARGFDMSPNQDMFKAKNMLPSVKKGIKNFQSEFSNPTFKQTSEPEFITPVKTTHFSGTKIKAMKEGYELVDLDALMNDDIVEYKKISTPSNVFKSPKVELIRENNRDSITEFIVKYQGHELPEYYNRRQLGNLSLRTLNEYYNRLVQRLGLLEEEKKHDALIRIDALNKQSQKDSNSYYKKDVNKTTSMLVQKGEGDGLVYDKDSLEKKDIPKYKYQSEHQQDYLEKIHRGLEDFVPENQPNGEVDPQWEARKKALMSTQEVGAKQYDSSKKRIKAKQDNKLGTNKAVLMQKDLPAVKKDDKVLKENSFTVINEGNILNQIQSYYIDEENRKKPVIFDSNNIIEMKKINETKLIGCKELTYKGLGQTLSEDFKNKVLNKKLLYSPDSKKVFLV